MASSHKRSPWLPTGTTPGWLADKQEYYRSYGSTRSHRLKATTTKASLTTLLDCCLMSSHHAWNRERRYKIIRLMAKSENICNASDSMVVMDYSHGCHGLFSMSYILHPQVKSKSLYSEKFGMRQTHLGQTETEVVTKYHLFASRTINLTLHRKSFLRSTITDDLFLKAKVNI